MVEEFFGAIGRSVLGACARCGRFSLLALDTFRQLFRQRPSVRHTLQQMAHLGVNSLPIVMLTMLFTGMVMTVQTASEFIKYGAQSSVGGVIAIAMGRELSPVLTGVVVAGRVGAAITAEISTMKVTEQIDALRVMATNPVGYLVVPRMIACMVMVPLLTVFGDVIGVLGGWLIAVNYSGITTFMYFNSIDIFMASHDLTGGLVKAAVFGLVIAIIGCYYGLNAPNGAEGVGRATTRSVVGSIILIFMTNVFLSLILY